MKENTTKSQIIECLFLIYESLVLLISRHEGPFVTCLLSKNQKLCNKIKAAKRKTKDVRKKEVQDCAALPGLCCVVGKQCRTSLICEVATGMKTQEKGLRCTQQAPLSLEASQLRYIPENWASTAHPNPCFPLQNVHS